jgi:periplasmic divalent cation tolerance protein
MQDIACLYWTINNQELPQALVIELIDKKLIACANILPGVSMYSWQGKMHGELQVFVFCKTSADKLEQAIFYLEKTHDYDVLCITSWLVQANPKYAGWVASVI